MKSTIPNTILICYADEQMQTSQQLCIKSAREKADIELCSGYTPDFILSDTDFYLRNEATLEATQRGGGKGWWLWKPYIVEHALRDYAPGSYVIYADVGVEFISSIKPLIELMEKTKQEILLFGNGHTHLIWCKDRVLSAMLPGWWKTENIGKLEQVQASVMLFKVSDYTRRFAREWLAWSEIPGFIDDSDNTGVTNMFRDHRNDQAILTNLAIREGIQLHWWPVQYGHVNKNNYNDTYDQLFYHHRWREQDWHDNNMTIEQFQKLPKNQ